MAIKPVRLLHETLERSAASDPDKIAIYSGAEQLTYGELNRAAEGLAACLEAHGLQRGDRVAVFMENSLEAAVSVYAALKAGAAFVLINPQTKSDKLRFILNDCGARHLITERQLEKVTDAALEAAPTVSLLIIAGTDREHTSPTVTSLSFAEATASARDERPHAAAIPLDLAALIYTSGSTGNPKGVMQTHQSMVFALGSLLEYLELEPDDVILNVLPLAFDYGLYQLLMTVHIGATLVLERSFAYPGSVLKQVRRHSVTVFPGVPTIFSMLNSIEIEHTTTFPTVRRVTNTGAALPQQHLPGIRRLFPNAFVYAMYGLTECKRVSYLDPSLIDEKPGSVGCAIPGTEVFLLSPDGEPVGADMPGILHVRGPHVMLGYWKDPEESAKALVPGHYPGEQVLKTGDWFKMDREGYLYFLGRSDDIIKTRGEKVSPIEVEAALLRVAGIQEAAVKGVSDAVLGEAVKAYVVPCPGMEFSEQKIRRELMRYLESFMVPREIVCLDALPKSPNGKVAISALP